jgi:hypothetical protein
MVHLHAEALARARLTAEQGISALRDAEAQVRARLAAEQGATALRLAEFCGVPDDMRGRFCSKLGELFDEAWKGWEIRSAYPVDSALLEAERALKVAKDAVDKLSMSQKHAMGGHQLEELVRQIAKLTGSNPYPRKAEGVGRPKGSSKNYPWAHFVKWLFEIVRYYGGSLPFDKKRPDKLLAALGILRPVLPPGLIPNVPALSTIEKIKKGKRPPLYS